MSTFIQAQLVAAISEINTPTNRKITLSATRPLGDRISEFRGKHALALQLELRYDACTTLKINLHSVSGSPNREPPGWPEMSSPAVKRPLHRSKAHNQEVSGANLFPATHRRMPRTHCILLRPPIIQWPENERDLLLGPGEALTVTDAAPGTRYLLMAGQPYGETPRFNGPYVD